MICDFCSSQQVFQVYMAEDFMAIELRARDGHPLYLNSTGGWAACRECAVLIEAEKWDDLLERSCQTFKASMPIFLSLTLEEEGEIRRMMRGVHEQFRKLRQQAA